MSEGRDFLEICQEQGVQLNPNIRERLLVPYEAADFPPLLEAINTAGRLLRNWSADQISSGPVELPARYSTHVLAGILQTVINSPHQPELTKGLSNFESSLVNVGSCSAAEGYFFNVINALDSVSRFGFVKDRRCGARIIVDNVEPVIIQKDYIEASGLTLKPISLGGVAIPAGSIVALDMSLKYRPPSNRVDVVSKEHVKGLGFKRLSEFAIPVEARAEILGYERPYENEARFSMEDALEFISTGLQRARRERKGFRDIIQKPAHPFPAN